MNWHKRYIDLAKTTASWSKDPSRKIGAVIIGENNQIETLVLIFGGILIGCILVNLYS